MNVQPQKRGRGRPRTGGCRDEVLEAALEMFAERGFHGATMEEIAARAGIATGTIYRHFASKEILVNELYRKTKHELAEALLVNPPETPDLRLQFNHLWWALVGFVRFRPLAFAFLELHHHGSYLDGDSRALELRVLGPINAVVELGRHTKVLKPLPAEALIVTVWGAFCGMVKAARLGYYDLTDQLCAQVEETCWDAIRST